MTAGTPAEPAALREREAQLRSILETVPDGMIVIDERGIVQSFSPAAERMFGFAAAAVCGRNVSLLMPSPHRENHDAYMQRYLTTGERRIIGVGRVVAGQRKDGSTFPIELAVGEVNSGGRRLFTGFVRDISERQLTRQRLQELQSELSHVSRVSEMGQMASALAHEINQPLTAASNYLQGARRLAERSADPPSPVLHALAQASAQVERASQILRRLRTFIKKGVSEKAPEDVAKLIEEASAIALVGARERGIAVHLRAAAGLPPVAVDKIQIQQVVVNLMRNAIEAMEASPRRELAVEAELAPQGDRVIVRVADTGPGLASQVADRLFQPFVTTKAQGMGVGLLIYRSIARGHDGELVARAGVEEGTVFEFTLPVAGDQRPARGGAGVVRG